MKLTVGKLKQVIREEFVRARKAKRMNESGPPPGMDAAEAGFGLNDDPDVDEAIKDLATVLVTKLFAGTPDMHDVALPEIMNDIMDCVDEISQNYGRT